MSHQLHLDILSQRMSNYPYQSDNRNQTLQRKKSRKIQFETVCSKRRSAMVKLLFTLGIKIRLEIGATSTIVQKDEDTDLTGNYIVTQLRHTFNQSGDAKHSIVMRVAKDSKQGNLMVILFKMLICYTKTVYQNQLQNQQIQNTIHTVV